MFRFEQISFLRRSFSVLNFIAKESNQEVTKMPLFDGLMGDFAILRPFQQYFSYIRTMGDDYKRLFAMKPRLRLKRFSGEWLHVYQKEGCIPAGAIQATSLRSDPIDFRLRGAILGPLD